MLGSISNTALSALNQATASNEFPCFFNDTYTKETILFPWDLSRPTAQTPYKIRDNLGNPASYIRIGSEDGETYFNRIYDKAGICSAPSNCCIQYSSPVTTCNSAAYAECDYGDNCAYPCESIKLGIIEGYKALVKLYDKEQRMTADLGVLCPENFEDTCPTMEFKSLYTNSTIVGLIENYKVKIMGTKDSLVNLASTSVGDAMIEVEDFLCNMNASFVEQRYNEVKNDLCGKLFGGVAQINWALWLLGMSLEVVAVLTHILTVRLRGLSRKEAELDMIDLDGGRGLMKADLYG